MGLGLGTCALTQNSIKALAINAFRNEKSCKKGIKAKRYKATLQPAYAQKVLNGIFEHSCSCPEYHTFIELGMVCGTKKCQDHSERSELRE